MTKSGSQKLHICPKVHYKKGSIIGHKIDYNGVRARRGQWPYPAKCIIRYNIECCRKYIRQIYTDSLVHDEKTLNLLVDTIGQVNSSVTFWL